MGKTDYLGNRGDFYFHKTSENEGGYNYYAFVNRSGKVYIMREEISTGNCLYADGRYSLDNAWTNRVSLDYDYINKI